MLKNVVIAENANVEAPESIKQCVMEFVADLRKNFWRNWSIISQVT
ncbi:MAG: hypothetical protein L6U16_03970 [Porphyromonadaceae bacterium]|nr:MAG: hypothetical protein L6U16_03970 [Porphyromonadaceae bacterium]